MAYFYEYVSTALRLQSHYEETLLLTTTSPAGIYPSSFTNVRFWKIEF